MFDIGKSTIYFSAFLLLAGCSTVHVVDSAGAAIPNAEVWSVSLSMNIGPNLTDSNGNAEVPSNVQGTKWIEIKGKGYKSITVEVPSKYPIAITLDKE